MTTSQQTEAVAAAYRDIERTLQPGTLSFEASAKKDAETRRRPHVVMQEQEDTAPKPTITERIDRLDMMLGVIYRRLDAINQGLEERLGGLEGRLG
jgi:hypothetical protein